MSADLTDLSRRVAATGKWEPRPGQAVRDPITDARFRLTDNGWCDEDGIAADPEAELLPQRAIAAGPDLDDEVTALALLADFPLARLERVVYGPQRIDWCIEWQAEHGLHSKQTADRAMCIALAWLAVHGGDHG